MEDSDVYTLLYVEDLDDLHNAAVLVERKNPQQPGIVRRHHSCQAESCAVSPSHDSRFCCAVPAQASPSPASVPRLATPGLVHGTSPHAASLHCSSISKTVANTLRTTSAATCTRQPTPLWTHDQIASEGQSSPGKLCCLTGSILWGFVMYGDILDSQDCLMLLRQDMVQLGHISLFTIGAVTMARTAY